MPSVLVRKGIGYVFSFLLFSSNLCSCIFLFSPLLMVMLMIVGWLVFAQDFEDQEEDCPQGEAEPTPSSVVPVQDRYQDPVCIFVSSSRAGFILSLSCSILCFPMYT